MANYLLGIDVGTSSCKAVLITTDGKVFTLSSLDTPIIHPKFGWAEQDPEVWWTATTQLIKKTIKDAGISGRDIVGVGIASQRRSVVPVDSKGKKLTNSIIWLDRRAEKQAKEIRNRISQSEVLKITGLELNQNATAAKILWLKENRPTIFRGTSKFLLPKGFVLFKLTDRMSTDYSMASKTLLFDIKSLMWSSRILDVLEIPIEKLPTICSSVEVVGEVTKQAAEQTGLRKGTPVVGGGGDRQCEAIGSGIIGNGLSVGTGTATSFTTAITHPEVDLKARVDCCCHVIPDMWVYEANIRTTGACIRWFKENFGYEEIEKAEKNGKSPYRLFDELASKISAGSDGLFYYPFPQGSRAPAFNESLKASFYGQTLDHTKAHFIRAIYEGVAFQYIGIVNLLREFGLKIRNISVAGGETKSEIWNQIKANILGFPIKIPEILDAAVLGSAIIAGMGVEEFSNWQSAVNQTVTIKKIYEPNVEVHKSYVKICERYWKIHKILEEAYRA